MPAQTIDEVLVQLDEIIARTRREKSRLGFFAVLYRNVTLKVREGIKAGLFEDGPRMERLDVTFANRYLSAYESFQRGEQLSKCWLVAFEAAALWPPIILQHLLIGMNAHINFDLGIAAAEVAPGGQLQSLKHDFDQINNILGGMVAKVKSNVDELSPWINLIDRLVDAQAGDQIINFSLTKARQSAWLVATMVAQSSSSQREKKLAVLDDAVAAFGRLIRKPVGVLLNLGLWVVRLRESNDIPRVIDVLSQM
ncbi:MAG TPA: DUF5995 family protein [Pyrinomonadaceae bacterium]|nr:DUF5995 family protein [Pyrinomonadaceae bacterium]